jgi:Flp pilus assembly protein TadG
MPYGGVMMMRSVEQKNGEAGSALVEFAVASVIILTVLFGIIDMGRALYSYDWVSDAARRGSRYSMVRGQESCQGTLHLTDCMAQTGTAPYSTPNTIGYYIMSNGFAIDRNAVTVTTACWPDTKALNGAPCPAGTAVIVGVKLAFSWITPFMPRTLNWKMSSSSAVFVSQ